MKKTILTVFFALMSIGIIAKGKRVLFIGDSITDGAWGNSKVWNMPSEERNHKDMNHIYGHGYMMIVASYYQGLFPEDQWTFWNRGISGNTLADLTQRWEKDAISLSPDVVSILVGTNDVAQALDKGYTIDTSQWEKDYRALLDAVLKQNPDATFMLCTPFVAKSGKLTASDNFPEREAMISSLVTAIERISHDYPATLVPFNALVSTTISSHPGVPSEYWIWDGIHPTPALHYLMAQKWIEMFRL